MEKKAYRSDRRNAARAAGILNKWRLRARIKTAMRGVRWDESVPGKRTSYFVYTYIVGN